MPDPLDGPNLLGGQIELHKDKNRTKDKVKKRPKEDEKKNK